NELQSETRDPAGRLLLKTVNDWDSDCGPVQSSQEGTPTFNLKNARIIKTTTTLGESGQVSSSETDYDHSVSYASPWPGQGCVMNPPASFTESMMNVVETREYDYGSNAPGALLRRTHVTWLHDADTNYKS